MLNITFSGTILSWVPKPNKAAGNKATVPKCWVECDGRKISEGIWKGQKTPDLNNAQRFLRGGTQNQALGTQSDALQDHHHNLYDPGHSHRYNDKYWERYARDHGQGATELDRFDDTFDKSHYTYTSNSKSGIYVRGVKYARTSTETRPKNMKVTFIMKVC